MDTPTLFLRGREITWRKALLIAAVVQAIPYGLWSLDRAPRPDSDMWLTAMYFFTPLLSAWFWRSWKVFLCAVSITVALWLSELLYYLS